MGMAHCSRCGHTRDLPRNNGMPIAANNLVVMANVVLCFFSGFCCMLNDRFQRTVKISRSLSLIASLWPSLEAERQAVQTHRPGRRGAVIVLIFIKELSLGKGISGEGNVPALLICTGGMSCVKRRDCSWGMSSVPKPLVNLPWGRWGCG